MKLIEFEDIDDFKSNYRTKDSPLMKFYMFIRKKCRYNKDKIMNNKQIFVNPKDRAFLEYLMHEWMKKNEKLDPLGKYVTMTEMFRELGPTESEHVKRGKVLIDV